MLENADTGVGFELVMSSVTTNILKSGSLSTLHEGMQNGDWKLQDQSAENATADIYDYLYYRTWFARQNYGNFAKTIQRFIHPDATVLELGCGTGTVSNLVGSQCNCMDFSEKMLSIAKTKVQGSCVQADMEHLPYVDKTFDVVFVNSALHHFPSLDKIIQEINRILKKDGHLLIQEPNSHSIKKDALLKVLAYGIRKIGAKKYPDVSSLEVRPSDHHAPLLPSKLITSITTNGFGIESLRHRYYASYILSGFDSKLALIVGKLLDRSYVWKMKQGYMLVVIARKGQSIEKVSLPLAAFGVIVAILYCYDYVKDRKNPVWYDPMPTPDI